jgi:hypothetical protein
MLALQAFQPLPDHVELEENILPAAFLPASSLRYQPCWNERTTVKCAIIN